VRKADMDMTDKFGNRSWCKMFSRKTQHKTLKQYTEIDTTCRTMQRATAVGLFLLLVRLSWTHCTKTCDDAESGVFYSYRPSL